MRDQVRARLSYPFIIQVIARRHAASTHMWDNCGVLPEMTAKMKEDGQSTQSLRLALFFLFLKYGLQRLSNEYKVFGPPFEKLGNYLMLPILALQS